MRHTQTHPYVPGTEPAREAAEAFRTFHGLGTPLSVARRADGCGLLEWNAWRTRTVVHGDVERGWHHARRHYTTRAQWEAEQTAMWALARWDAEQPLWERSAAYSHAMTLTDAHYERLGSAYLEALCDADMVDCWVCDHCPSGADHTAVATTTVVTDSGEEQWCGACADDASECRRSRCHTMVEDGATVEVDGDQWCPSCAEEYAYTCQSCDYRTQETSTVITRRNGEQQWCDSCAGDAYRCEGCEERFERLNGDYCDACQPEEEEEEGLVKSYHHHKNKGRPIESEWTRAQHRPLFFGVECEVECPEDSDVKDYARKVVDSATQCLLGLEEDGSLEHGFEIITHPAGLDTHRRFWEGLKTKGLTSHDTTTCGLHVHMSKAALRPLTIGRMQVFIHEPSNAPFVEGVCRRTFNRYAKSIAPKLTDHTDRPDRYEALNLTNSKTVELRLPKGSIQPATIMGTLEFCYALIRFCEQASNACLTTKAFLAFITTDAMLSDTRALRTYLVTRGLADAPTMKLPKPNKKAA